jgi:hypothetical protein
VTESRLYAVGDGRDGELLFGWPEHLEHLKTELKIVACSREDQHEMKERITSPKENR